MSYSITITDSLPPVRTAEAGPWTHARLDESAVRSGPFTPIETFTLDPVDTDPTVPLERTFTSEVATLPAGWYTLTWLDASGDQAVSDAFWAGSGVRPSVQEVANLMLDRTTTDGGTEAGTFTTETTPTAAQVEQMIDMVMDSIAPKVDESADGEVQRAARWVTTLKTAVLIETSRAGDRLEVNEDRIAVWNELIKDNLTTVTDASGSTITLDDPWVMV